MGGEGLAILMIILFGGLILGGSDSSEDDLLADEETPPPETGDPTIYDDDDATDNGFALGTLVADIISGGLRADGPGAENVDTTTPDDFLIGQSGEDVLLGGIGNDLLDGADGNDLLIAGDGDDVLFGSFDNDILFGGDGNDLLDGGFGENTAYGGKGNDWFYSFGSSDTYFGESGDDLFFPIFDGPHEMDGGSGDDIFVQPGIFGTGHELTGGTGNDIFSMAQGGQTVTDFGNDDGLAGDGDTGNNDYIDLWRHYDTLDQAKADLVAGLLDTGPLLPILLDGVTADDLTEDNTGLSNNPGTFAADFSVSIEPSGPTVLLAPRPILGGPATLVVDWGDGNPPDVFSRAGAPEFLQRPLFPGLYNVTLTILPDGPYVPAEITYAIDTVAGTATYVPPVFA